jgi:5-dehydro-2-deoxygluconokinase
MAAKAGAPLARINQLKELLLEAALRTSAEMPADRSFGILADDVFAQDVLNKATGSHLWIGRPIEVPGSRPLELVGGRSVGTTLKAWPVEHVVKCLIYYDPDDAIELRNAQERQVEELYAACGESGHEFLLEIIPQKSAADWENSVVRSIRRFYNLRVYPDWWKLPGLSDKALRDISDLITERAPDCRGVLTLGLAESIDTLAKSLSSVSQYPICKGFAVGRTIFAEPSERWLRNALTDDEFIDVIAGRYQRLITSWIGVNNQPEAKV